jgi:hypothetical protein
VKFKVVLPATPLHAAHPRGFMIKHTQDMLDASESGQRIVQIEIGLVGLPASSYLDVMSICRLTLLADL